LSSAAAAAGGACCSCRFRVLAGSCGC
jgi:hypothetical protein